MARSRRPITPEQRKSIDLLTASEQSWGETRSSETGEVEIVFLDFRGVPVRTITVLADGTSFTRWSAPG